MFPFCTVLKHKKQKFFNAFIGYYQRLLSELLLDMKIRNLSLVSRALNLHKIIFSNILGEYSAEFHLSTRLLDRRRKLNIYTRPAGLLNILCRFSLHPVPWWVFRNLVCDSSHRIP